MLESNSTKSNTFAQKRLPALSLLIKPALFGAVLVAATLLTSQESVAQNQGVTVQLPVITNFNINTTVSVPDGGTMSLGGIGRYNAARTSRGVPGLSNTPFLGRGFGNRAVGREVAGGGASVSVQILIMEELEKEVLAEAERRQALRRRVDPNGSVETQRKADFISRNIGRNLKRR